MKEVIKKIMILFAFTVLFVAGTLNMEHVLADMEISSIYQLYLIPEKPVLLSDGVDQTKIDIFLKASEQIAYPKNAEAIVRFTVEGIGTGGISQDEVNLVYDSEKQGWFGQCEFVAIARDSTATASIEAKIYSSVNFKERILGLTSNKVNIIVTPYLMVSRDGYVDLSSKFITLTDINDFTEQLSVLSENKANGIQWNSSNPSAVTVDDDGTLKAAGRGASIITASIPQTEYCGYCIVSVTDFFVKTTGVTVSNTLLLSKNMSVDFATLVKVLPENASNQSYTLESSNMEVAWFNGTELVPKANGMTTVTVTTNEGGYTATCQVTVNGFDDAGKKKQKIKAKSLTKTYGSKSFKLKAKTSGNGKLKYSSSSKKVAVVTKKGKVTIKGYGKTTITIKASKTNTYLAAKKKITLEVVPKQASITKLTSTGRKKIYCSWQTDSSVTAYQVYICEKKDFSRGVMERFLQKPFGLVGLRSGKTYYVKIRAYKKIGKTRYYGKWSAVKSVKVR